MLISAGRLGPANMARSNEKKRRKERKEGDRQRYKERRRETSCSFQKPSGNDFMRMPAWRWEEEQEYDEEADVSERKRRALGAGLNMTAEHVEKPFPKVNTSVPRLRKALLGHYLMNIAVTTLCFQRDGGGRQPPALSCHHGHLDRWRGADKVQERMEGRGEGVAITAAFGGAAAKEIQVTNHQSKRTNH